MEGEVEDDTNFEHAKVLAFYEIKAEDDSSNFVMIAQG